MSTTKRTRRFSKPAKRTDWTKALPPDAATATGARISRSFGGGTAGSITLTDGIVPKVGEVFDPSLLPGIVCPPMRCVVTGISIQLAFREAFKGEQ